MIFIKIDIIEGPLTSSETVPSLTSWLTSNEQGGKGVVGGAWISWLVEIIRTFLVAGCETCRSIARKLMSPPGWIATWPPGFDWRSVSTHALTLIIRSNVNTHSNPHICMYLKMKVKKSPYNYNKTTKTPTSITPRPFRGSTGSLLSPPL